MGDDKAMFSDIRAAYTCTDLSGPTPQLLARCPREWNGGRIEVSHLAGGVVDPGEVPGADDLLVANDGTDIVENVEELVFSDSAPPGTPTGVTAVAGNGNAQVSFIPPAGVVDSYDVQVLDSSGAAGRSAARDPRPGSLQPPGRRADQRAGLHLPRPGSQRLRSR